MMDAAKKKFTYRIFMKKNYKSIYVQWLHGILRRFIGLRGFLSINITCLKTRIFRKFLLFKIHEKNITQ